MTARQPQRRPRPSARRHFPVPGHCPGPDGITCLRESSRGPDVGKRRRLLQPHAAPRPLARARTRGIKGVNERWCQKPPSETFAPPASLSARSALAPQAVQRIAARSPLAALRPFPAFNTLYFRPVPAISSARADPALAATAAAAETTAVTV